MTMEEDPVDRASSARRERLKALRAAKEYMSMPDDEPAQGQSRAEAGSEDDGENEKKVMITGEESIEQPAAARRERLKGLKTAKELLSTPDEDLVQNENKEENSEETEDEKRQNMKFRNYLPHDKQLQEGKLAPVVLPKFEDPILAAPPSEKNEDPFVNIAPKKPNWDLRRDVQKKLDKLERRTQKALYHLMQEQEKEKEAAEAPNGVAED